MVPCLISLILSILILLPILTLGPIVCIENSNNISGIIMAVLELFCIFLVIINQIGLYVYREEFVMFVNTFLRFEFSDRECIKIPLPLLRYFD